MASNTKEFLLKLSGSEFSNADRAVSLIWWHSRTDPSHSVEVRDIANEIHKSGYAKLNISRLRQELSKDKRTAKGGVDSFRIRVGTRQILDDQLTILCTSKIIKASDSVLPRELFVNTRGYIETIVRQINASYDTGLFDCTAVMCRRLLETLIIEAYENLGKESLIKDSDGNYRMLSGLLNDIEKNKSITLSRNGLAGLKAFKRLGDLSAHNRKFNARQSDITKIEDGIRVASEELLHIAKIT